MSSANISLCQTIRCCLLIVNYNKILYFRALTFLCHPLLSANHKLKQGNIFCLLTFLCHTLFSANHKLQQGNILSSANILSMTNHSLLIVNANKVIYWLVLYFSTIRCFLLIINRIKAIFCRQQIFLCSKTLYSDNPQLQQGNILS